MLSQVNKLHPHGDGDDEEDDDCSMLFGCSWINVCFSSEGDVRDRRKCRAARITARRKREAKKDKSIAVCVETGKETLDMWSLVDSRINMMGDRKTQRRER